MQSYLAILCYFKIFFLTLFLNKADSIINFALLDLSCRFMSQRMGRSWLAEMPIDNIKRWWNTYLLLWFVLLAMLEELVVGNGLTGIYIFCKGNLNILCLQLCLHHLQHYVWLGIELLRNKNGLGDQSFVASIVTLLWPSPEPNFPRTF